ncbi:MAG: TetR/AcrR family transcriptional regulator [Comamonas sp.]
MSKKPPRRTAERILEVALDLCNRFGMTNVSTTQIAAEMRISPGNLYYHYASKDDLINTLFDRHEAAMVSVLNTSDLVRDVAGAWSFAHDLFDNIWQYRFIYRDLNHLLANNHRVETHMQVLLARKQAALDEVLQALGRYQIIRLTPPQTEVLTANLVLVLMYWLSYEYVRDPRQALEPGSGASAVARGTWQLMRTLSPYLLHQGRIEFEALEQGRASSDLAVAARDEGAVSLAFEASGRD